MTRALTPPRVESSWTRPSRSTEAFLSDIAVPVVRQAAAVLNGSGYAFIVHTPAVGVRLAAEKSPDTFLELELDTSGDRPEVIGRVSVSRARHGQVVEERPIAPGTAVDALSDEEVSAFLVGEIPKLVTRR